MIEGIEVIGFDADDTLWVNEPYYREAEAEFIQLVASYGVNGNIAGALFETEISNLRLYGYGIKAFMLSLVECAIQLTDGAVNSGDISRIIGIGKSMLERPIELLGEVQSVLEKLTPHYRLIVATKGDLLDQERKMRRSGIADYFHHIEVMIGNSLKSDIVPPLELGAWGVYVPYHTTWAHEELDREPESSRYFKLEKLWQVLDLLPVS